MERRSIRSWLSSLLVGSLAPTLLIPIACTGRVAQVDRAKSEVSVTVAPRTAQTVPEGHLPFTALVAGTSNLGVTWAVVQAGGGTVDGTGLYTAPKITGAFNILATSTADPTKFGMALATVATPSSTDTTGILDPSRRTTWSPGLNAVGGIPSRNAACATLSPSGGDDTAALSSAIANCPAGQVVMLNPGTFRVSVMGVTFEKSGVTVRGSVDVSGRPTTVIQKAAGQIRSAMTIGIGTSPDKFALTGGIVDLAADGVKGANSVKVTAIPKGLTVGEVVKIDQLFDPNLTNWSITQPDGTDGRYMFCRNNRPVSQVLEVASIDALNGWITFTTPLHIDFTTAQAAQLLRYGEDWAGAYPATTYAGVENVRFSGGATFDATQDGGLLTFSHTAYCWARNIETDHSMGGGVVLAGAFRSEVRDSYLHEGYPANGGAGYILDVTYGASDNLIENNAVWNADKLIVMRASGGGNVVGYNYFEDAWSVNFPNDPESGINAAHFTTPHMELFEGNQAFRADSDETWGNSVYLTFFRNHLTGRRRSIPPLSYYDQNVACITTQSHSWYFNFLGNVLGSPGMPLAPQTSWEYDETDMGNIFKGKFWSLGNMGNQGPAYDWSAPPSQLVKDRTVRHMNYNVAVGGLAAGIQYATGLATTLPKSLYLTAKPAFFGANPWPWVSPENPGTPVATLPARARFDSMH